MSEDVARETPESPTPEPAPQPALPQVTSAAEWKRKLRAQFLVTLPSGSIVRARRLDLGKLLADGVMSPSMAMNPINAQDQDGYNKAIEVAKPIIPYIVVSPVFVLPNGSVPADDTISVDEISSLDVLALFTWATDRGTLPAIEIPDGQ